MGGGQKEQSEMGDSAVIDASTFSEAHHAFWQAYTPTCEHFVRRLNLDGVVRFSNAVEKSPMQKRWALIAEYGFSLFAERTAGNLEHLQNGQKIYERAWIEAKKRLLPFRREGLDLDHRLDEEELREAEGISVNIARFLEGRDRALVLRPIFAGCGFVDASEGDMIVGRALYEIKAVDRQFRSGDIRQLLTYAALNHASGQFLFSDVGLLNPRRGIYCEFDLEHLCGEISGRPALDLLALIASALSSGDISR
jgi:hypothetical protein